MPKLSLSLGPACGNIQENPCASISHHGLHYLTFYCYMAMIIFSGTVNDGRKGPRRPIACGGSLGIEKKTID
jgi:hypothetical protein